MAMINLNKPHAVMKAYIRLQGLKQAASTVSEEGDILHEKNVCAEKRNHCEQIIAHHMQEACINLSSAIISCPTVWLRMISTLRLTADACFVTNSIDANM